MHIFWLFSSGNGVFNHIISKLSILWLFSPQATACSTTCLVCTSYYYYYTFCSTHVVVPLCCETNICWKKLDIVVLFPRKRTVRPPARPVPVPGQHDGSQHEPRGTHTPLRDALQRRTESALLAARRRRLAVSGNRVGMATAALSWWPWQPCVAVAAHRCQEVRLVFLLRVGTEQSNE